MILLWAGEARSREHRRKMGETKTGGEVSERGGASKGAGFCCCSCVSMHEGRVCGGTMTGRHGRKMTTDVRINHET